ncbi:MAG: leucine-rich repeat domain-containing protein, partial [Clostridiales bacterium]|nr:leucine-rich repeat domain-containing protein [Clostridiales bacterium]
MKGTKNIISNEYTKIMLLALLVIASILNVYLVTNTNTKVFNAKIINQKADTREIVNIPDQDLKNFLLKYFKKPDNERKDSYNYYDLKLSNPSYIKPSDENEIYKDEMERIVTIRTSTINTKNTAMNLVGLEKAINLTQLVLPVSKIENIEPLRGLTNLNHLYLRENKIENIEVLKGLTNLNYLNLYGNKIENIEPLRGLTNLTELDLGNNKIENIEALNGLTSLKYLYLTNNKIENIEPLRGLTNLNYLYLRENKIENIEVLKGLTNLTNLVLEYNEIENIEPLKGLTNLTNLSLYNNKIENIEPLKGLTNLMVLSLDNNEIENIKPLSELTNLNYLNLYGNKIENIEPLSELTNLNYLNLYNNKIENIEPLKGLRNLTTLYLYNEEINVSPNTNKFNLPVLKKYNREILDIVQASNGLLKKNEDGTYSFTRKVTGVQTVNVGVGIWGSNPKVDTNWNYSYPIYILKINPINIADEKVSITKTIKDKSNTLLNNDKETKVVPVIKRNGQVITHANTNNVGHRANNDELLTYTWNELPKLDDTYTDYNYEVTFDISGLPEGYSIEPNTKTADNQADFNITYVSPKVTVTKDIIVNGGNKSRLPNEITVTISNDKGLPEKEVIAPLKADKSGYVVNESLDKTTNTGENITYTVVLKTDITNYRKTENSYEYEVQNTEVKKTLPVNGGNKESLPRTLKVNIINKDNGSVIKEV